MPDVTAAVGHEKVGHTNQGLWHQKGMQLPAFIQHIANDLIKERGMPESQAIATAISQCKKWAAGGRDVKPETRAKAAAAIAEWEALKAKAKGKKAAASADTAPEFLAASTLAGVELARPGAWKLATGPRTFTEQMLRDAADFYAATGGQGVPIGLGHTDTRFDGDPAFGRVTNIRYATDDRGPVLLGDVVDMTDWMAAAAPKRWPYRSIEGFCDFEYQGRTYALALTRLALLGATPPAIMDLQSLQEAVAAAAATSGAEHITATAPDAEPEPPSVPEAQAVIDEQVGRFIAEQLNDPETLPDPGTEASPLLATTPPIQEGAGMDPAKLREAFGLKPDASDDEVAAAYAAAGLKVAASAPTPTAPPDPAPADSPTVDPADQPNPANPQQPPAKPSAGTVVIDASQMEGFLATNRKMEAIAAKLARNERDEVITSAIRAGKFPQARRQHWEKVWDADPDGAKQTIESLAANLVPIAASGYQGDPDAEFDMDYSALYPPEVKVRG